jgi:hypothetical protein
MIGARDIEVDTLTTCHDCVLHPVSPEMMAWRWGLAAILALRAVTIAVPRIIVVGLLPGVKGFEPAEHQQPYLTSSLWSIVHVLVRNMPYPQILEVVAILVPEDHIRKHVEEGNLCE